MKHLKTYEENSTEPQIGDYVYCIIDKADYLPIDFFGIIINIKGGKNYPYTIECDNVIDYKERVVNRNEIIAFSKNRQDIEHFYDANKYNI